MPTSSSSGKRRTITVYKSRPQVSEGTLNQVLNPNHHLKMNCKIFFLVLINILYVCSSPYLNHFLTKRSRYCGSHLTNTLSLVCRGRYPSPDKKSFGQGLNYNEYEGDYNDLNENELEFPFLSKELAKSLVPQKMRRGVFNECCQKPCTLTELSYYCAAD